MRLARRALRLASPLRLAWPVHAHPHEVTTVAPGPDRGRGRASPRGLAPVALGARRVKIVQAIDASRFVGGFVASANPAGRP